MSTEQTTTSTKPKWTIGTLMKLYAIDAGSAFVASFSVAPFISIVDRSIVENTNGKTPLVKGLLQGLRHFFTRPHHFIATPQFRLVLTVYFSTYLTANTIMTTCEGLEQDSAMPKFLGTTLTNMSLSIYKDRAFTRIFGTTVAHSLPLASYALFCSRDALTVAASFNAPEHVSGHLQRAGIVGSKGAGDSVAQLVCPAAVQLLSTPMHLLGLDLYNRPVVTPSQRVGLIRLEYLKSALARIARIAPAFGIGGIGNAKCRSLRQTVLKRAEAFEEKKMAFHRT